MQYKQVTFIWCTALYIRHWRGRRTLWGKQWALIDKDSHFVMRRITSKGPERSTSFDRLLSALGWYFYLMQRCLLHQLEGRRVNLAVFEIHRFIKLLLLPFCYLKWEGDETLKTSILLTWLIYILYICARLTSDGVIQSSTSVVS